MRTRAVVFDLDGTLIDGYGGIHAALAFALGRLGISVPGGDRVREMVGHGIERLLERTAGRERAAEGVRLFREHYPAVAVEGSSLLPGVSAALSRLAAEGYSLAVASNKPARFSRMILDAKGVGDRFAAIVGPDAEHPPKPDPSMLRALLAMTGAAAGETVCVGDMEVDVDFARAAGCRVIVLPTGSRSAEFLRGAGADALIHSFDALPETIARFV